MSFLGGLGVGSFPHGKDLPPEGRPRGGTRKAPQKTGRVWNPPLRRAKSRAGLEPAPTEGKEPGGFGTRPYGGQRAGRVWNPPLRRRSARVGGPGAKSKRAGRVWALSRRSRIFLWEIYVYLLQFFPPSAIINIVLVYICPNAGNSCKYLEIIELEFYF